MLAVNALQWLARVILAEAAGLKRRCPLMMFLMIKHSHKKVVIQNKGFLSSSLSTVKLVSCCVDKKQCRHPFRILAQVQTPYNKAGLYFSQEHTGKCIHCTTAKAAYEEPDTHQHLHITLPQISRTWKVKHKYQTSPPVSSPNLALRHLSPPFSSTQPPAKKQTRKLKI